MCSIVALQTNHKDIEVYARFLRTLQRANDRGRDSVGLITSDGQEIKHIGSDLAACGLAADYLGVPDIIIANTRAEPTTEFVKTKTLNDVQPFTAKSAVGHVAVSHNGIIANDKQLWAQLDRDPTSDIDSAVLPYWFLQHDPYLSLTNEIVGSFALAIMKSTPELSILSLACNYKPLYMLRGAGFLLFASLPEYLRESEADNIQKLPAYTYIDVQPDLSIVQTPLLPEKTGVKRVVVICSGGLDSVVTAKQYVHAGHDVCLLHFGYDCKASAREREAVVACALEMGCSCDFVDTRAVFAGMETSLINPAASIVKHGAAGAEFAHEWVPARNLIFYAMALAYAESNHYDVIALGNNLEEAGAYPDNEMIFTKLFADLVPYSVNVNTRIDVEMPVGNLMKHEIVRLGVQLNAPMHKTWSCYEDGPLHCGECGPCFMRQTAFAMNEFSEVIEYANQAK